MTCCTTWRTRFSSSTPFAWQLRNSCLASRRACPGDDLLGCGDGLLGFLLLDSRGCRAGLFDELFRLQFDLFQDLFAGRFGPGQLVFDPFGVLQTLLDPMPTFVEHFQHRLVSEPFEYPGDDDESDHLRKEHLLGQTKTLRNLPERTLTREFARRGEHDQFI